MSDFKGRDFGGEIALWAVRWYCGYPIGYRDLETMMIEHGVAPLAPAGVHRPCPRPARDLRASGLPDPGAAPLDPMPCPSRS